MKKNQSGKVRGIAAGTVLSLLALVCLCQYGRITVFAESAGESAISQEAELDAVGGESTADADAALETAGSVLPDEIALSDAPGSYTMDAGWQLDETLSSDTVSVYKQDGSEDEAETSTISCSYLETNYSVQEYEQLRDMLTNNLLYSNVNAQISTSAVYTLAKDYLYIILVDDSSEDYRDIYHYVVGDYQCFCVQVKEYRAEAELAGSQDLQTPQEVGQSVAEGFEWKD
ncbi:MAG: hypothetical protein LUI87_14645 [Lachnospiraceae bacterium]|nr:hypothetical protein [Lachnospiraceae bacterium]